MPSEPLEPPVDVLHVEDDDAWAGLVQQWLSDRGMRVLRSRSGEEMRRYLSLCTVLPRCLIVDLTLGDDDGLALCDHVKASPRLQALPIVVLTGRSVEPREFLGHHALYRVEKGTATEEELAAVIHAILTQQDRAKGVIDAGDMRLEPDERRVLHAGKEIARLEPGSFSALALLARSSPIPVSDKDLYAAFLTRHAYRTPEHDYALRKTLRDYVSRLRRKLGPVLASRIERAEAGYFYIPAVSDGPIGHVYLK